MPRWSLRLQEAGYYTADGSPSISYRERIYRVFQRRTRQNSPNLLHLLDFDDSMEDMPFERDEPVTSCAPAQRTCVVTRAQSVRRNAAKCILHMWNVGRFLLTLLLACGVLHAHFKLEAVERELTVRTQQMEACCPVADTMANFALHSQGAMVLKELSSEAYTPTEYNICRRILCWLFGRSKENDVLQGDSVLRIEKRRCFQGDHGRFVIVLSDPILISAVTLGHITKSQSLSGSIRSAPRRFSVYGMQTSVDKGRYLGTAVYDENGPGFKTFVLSNPDSAVFSHVKIVFHNNWGNGEFTCIHALRVHGKLPETPDPERL